ncbi:MAG: amidase [bacterium]
MLSRRSFVGSLGYLGAMATLPSRAKRVAHERPLTDITTSSARRLATAIRRREVSSVEVVEAFLRRIEEVNPKLNAVVQLDREHALNAARTADDRVHRRNSLGPLHGVPMTVKDSFDTAGMISTAGTTGRKAFVPTHDATAVARVRNAGAIVLGKTNCSELTLSYETDNLVYGRTNNPYNLFRTSGGSSGGAAAILAASGSPLDIGSDTGGSIRVPSHFCGTAGLKPTSGRVPRTGHIIPSDGVFQFFTQIGPMARYVEDLALVLPILVGSDWHDPFVVSAPINASTSLDLGQLRIAAYTDNGIYPASKEVVRVVNDAEEALRKAGCAVASERPEELAQVYDLGNRLWRLAGGPTVRRLLAAAGTETVSAPLKPWLKPATSAPADEWTDLLEQLDRSRGKMLSFFENYDAIVCPPCAFAAPLHGATLKEDLDAAFSYSEVYNYVGWPAVVVRGGTSAEGLPIGVQIVARPWREDVALAIAYRLEHDLGGWKSPAL